MNVTIINGPIKGELQFNGIEVNGINTIKSINKISQLLRSVVLRLNKNLIRLYTDFNVLRTIKSNDTVLLFDSINQNDIINYIDAHINNDRKVYIFWNPIKKPTTFLNILKLKGWEVWSFDPINCKDYKLKYCGQFLPTKINYNITNTNPCYDLYFVGINKGRFHILNKIEQKYKPYLKIYFRKVNSIKSIFLKKYSKRISYEKCLSEASFSKALLDITQNGQSGLTLRVLESLLLNKKLITTNAFINRYSFYRADDIFILNEFTIDSLRDFIFSKKTIISDSIIKNYSFENWLRRIVANIEMDDFKF